VDSCRGRRAHNGRVRQLGVVLLALAVVAACSAAPSAATRGPATDLERQVVSILAPTADIVDQPLEDVLAKLDLPTTLGAKATEVVDQIRKTRDAVAAARKASSASGGPRLASVTPSVGTFSVPQFAVLFGQSLDELTKHASTLQSPGNPFSSRESGPTSFTTTTLSTTETYSASGAHVTGALRWAYSTITIETATGATLLHLTDDRTLIGAIDVCPDAAGSVPASLQTTATIVAQTASTTTTKKSTGAATFQGIVDDQATLRSVTQQTHSESTTVSASGDGGFSADTSVTWTAAADGEYLGGGSMGSMSGTVTPNGTASSADAANGAGWDIVLDGYALQPAYKAAQDLWRHGRCVMVTASDYKAETPIDTTAQGATQHDERVDPGSETKFNVGLKHRFGGAVSASTTAILTGGTKTITPNRIDEGSGSLTYKAPDEQDKKATVQLKSTSKRGIGTLVLDFHTGGDALTLTINGTLRQNSGFVGVNTTGEDAITIGPLEFKKTFGDTYEASGTWQSTIHYVTTSPGGTMTCDGSERGDLTMEARIETREGKRVWVIDPKDANVDDGTGRLNCFTPPVTIAGVTIGGNIPQDSDGGSGSIFVDTLRAFTLPVEGGSAAVQGSVSSPRGSFTVSGTAVGKGKT
jgi:hypothetical protein